MDNTTRFISDQQHEDGQRFCRTVGVSHYHVSGRSITAPSEPEATITRMQLNAALRELENKLSRFASRTTVTDFVWFRREVELLFNRILGQDSARHKS